MEEKIAEYESLRNEITQRLGFQQQIINFTLVLAGLLVPLIIKFDYPNEEIILALLLIGAFISLVLSFISLKQHIIIAQLSEYISREIKYENGKAIFEGWEKYHLDSKLRNHKICCVLSFLMGCADVGFSVIVGILYLVLFLFKFSKNIFNHNFLFFCFFMAITIVLACLIFTAIKIRSWVVNK